MFLPSNWLTSRSIQPVTSFIFIFTLVINTINCNCPNRMLIKPCLCIYKSKGFDITCESVSNIHLLHDSFGNLLHSGYSLEYLKIFRSNVPTLPNSLLHNLNIIHLLIHYNNLTNIEEDAFKSSQDTLESLDLSQNLLTKIPSESLKYLRSLVSLSLTYNSITIIPAKAFDGLNSLLRLNLFGNQIHTLDANAFAGVGGNLTIVNLGVNHLKTFPSESMIKLKSLSRLQVHENQIKSITSDTFKYFESTTTLDTLNLASNLISFIPDDCFKSLNVLSSLDLEGNQLTSLNQYSFRGLEDKLEWLKLNDNKFNIIPSNALSSLKKLRQLDLRNNNISEIHVNDFKGFGSNVKFVYLQKNVIKFIEDGSFDCLTGVQWMYLNSNQLTHLQYSWFKYIIESKTLAILDVHNNPLNCSCSLSWLTQLASDRIMSMPKDTKCIKSDSTRTQPVLDFVSTCVINSGHIHHHSHDLYMIIHLTTFIIIDTLCKG